MTRKIIQEHGGSIKLQSQPAKGSTFIISLPRKRLPAPEPADQGIDTVRN